jgi:hypothetical protein
VRGPRTTVARRLLWILCTIAASSTGLALALQQRALSADLERAADRRLQRAVATADRLIDDHLRTLEERFAAISRASELSWMISASTNTWRPVGVSRMPTMVGLRPSRRIGTGLGGGRSTRISTVGIGAVTMKMMSSTNRMSMNGMTFGSDVGSMEPRLPLLPPED